MLIPGLLALAAALAVSAPALADTHRAVRIVGLTSTEIAVGPACASDDLPAGNVIAPRVYCVAGRAIDMGEEGLYRAIDRDGANIVQVVAYRSNLDALLSGIAWMTGHGKRDDSRYPDELLAIARTRNIGVTCTNAVLFGREVLRQAGIEARIVGGLTADAWNPYDNTHVVNEVKIDGRWAVVDFDADIAPFIVRDGERRRANLLDLHDALTSESELELQPLSPLRSADPMFGGGLYGALMDDIAANTKHWYARVFQIPFVQETDRDGFWTMSETDHALMRGVSYGVAMSPLSRAEFAAKLYGR